jgi:hypothetical protein
MIPAIRSHFFVERYWRRAWCVFMLFFTGVMLNAQAAPVPGDFARDRRACRAVVSLANTNHLADLEILFKEPGPKREARLRATDGYGEVADADFNGDGRPEHVVEVSWGSAHFSHFDVYDMHWKPIEIAKSKEHGMDQIDDVEDHDLIRFENRVYALGRSGDSLAYLSRVDPDNVERLVCKYSQRDVPIEKIVESKDDRLCAAVLKQKLEQPAWVKATALPDEVIEKGLGTSDFHDSGGVATIDIDNDGHADALVSLDFSGPSARGECTGNTLAVLNGRRDGLDIERTKVISGAGEVCNAVSVPFVFVGANYIDTEYIDGKSAGYHEVFQMKGRQLLNMCNFAVRPDNYILRHPASPANNQDNAK